MFTLDEIVPWGRSFDEYRHMFSLTEADLGRRIIGCGDGPASFNAEATRRGGHVISCDPLYQFDSAAIQQRITAAYDEIVDQTRQNADEFVWDAISTVDELGRIRMRAMRNLPESMSKSAPRSPTETPDAAFGCSPPPPL